MNITHLSIHWNLDPGWADELLSSSHDESVSSGPVGSLVSLKCYHVNKYTDKKKAGDQPGSHTKHTKGYLLPDPIDLRQEMMMAAPSIVLIVYGMANPIKFNPKIRIAPPITPTTKAKNIMPMIVPTKRAGLPFAFLINPISELILFLLFNIRS